MEVLVTSPQHPAATRPPRHDIAHVGHVELLTPEPEASLRFFVDVLGLTENGREGNSVYLRPWTTTSSTRSSSPRTTPLASAGSGCGRRARRRLRRASPRPRRPGSASAGRGGSPGVGPTILG